MDYREFVDQVAKDIRDVLGEDFDGAKITARQIDKLQGESYYGIQVQPVDSNIGVTVNLKDAYERYQEGASYGEAIQEVSQSVEEGMENVPNVEVSELMDYDSMKENLMIQVVPTEGNEELLAGIPHQEQEDMSIVYRMVLDTNEDGMASALVTNNMLLQYDITAEQLHADAMENAPERFPARIRSMQEVMAEMFGIEPEMMPDQDEVSMFIATCNSGVNGAGCIFYPEFMDQAAEKLNGDFFILPSSIHETILLPDLGDMNYHDLEAMVQQVNESEVEPKDRLSYSVYHYDSQEKIFEKAECFDQRMQEKKAEKGRPKEKQSLKEKLDAKKKEAASLDGGKKTPNKSQNMEL